MAEDRDRGIPPPLEPGFRRFVLDYHKDITNRALQEIFFAELARLLNERGMDGEPDDPFLHEYCKEKTRH